MHGRQVLPGVIFLVFTVALSTGCTSSSAPSPPPPLPVRVTTHPPTMGGSQPQPSPSPAPITLNLFAGVKTPTPVQVAVVTAVVIYPAEPPIPASVTPTPDLIITSPDPPGLPVESDSSPVYAKVGFHVASGGDARGLGEWMRTLDSAGVPFFLKSVDAAGPLYEAQELTRVSGVEHTLVYRRSGDLYELPDYSQNPIWAARDHWQRHVAAWPPELDPSLVWMETINEPDKNQAVWLALFALETGRLAVRDGRRWAAFGWATGEPEPEDWQSPAMLAFLRYAGEHPTHIAIALHEYSLTPEAIDVDYPFLVGRFQWLYLICDQWGIARPTVLITEWGWTYQTVPGEQEARAHIAWANRLYGRFPQVKGAAIWYLGSGWGGIGHQVRGLIQPITEMSSAPLNGLETAAIAPDLFARYYLEKAEGSDHSR